MGAEAARDTSASAWTLQGQWQLHQLLPPLPPPSFSISLLCAGLSGRPMQLLGCIWGFFLAWTSVLIEFVMQLNGRDGKVQGWVQRGGQLGWQCRKLLFLAEHFVKLNQSLRWASFAGWKLDALQSQWEEMGALGESGWAPQLGAYLVKA